EEYQEYLKGHPDYNPEIKYHLLTDKNGQLYYEPIEEIENYKRNNYYLGSIKCGKDSFVMTGDELLNYLNPGIKEEVPATLFEPDPANGLFLDFETYNALLGDAIIIYPFNVGSYRRITTEEANKVVVGMSMPEVMKTLDSRGKDENISLLSSVFEIEDYGYLVVYYGTTLSPEDAEYLNLRVNKTIIDEDGSITIRRRTADEYQEFLDALMTVKVTDIKFVPYGEEIVYPDGPDPAVP
ncbi:MAG: hypothetical protein J5850_01300, partial [Clostridia bacterium]|nr:hypothetical protein [Clostridia bacterium]